MLSHVLHTFSRLPVQPCYCAIPVTEEQKWTLPLERDRGRLEGQAAKKS